MEQNLTFGSPAGFEMKKKNCLLAHVFLFFHLSKRCYFVLQEIQVTWPTLTDTSGFSVATFQLRFHMNTGHGCEHTDLTEDEHPPELASSPVSRELFLNFL